MDGRKTGQVMWWDSARGYGFLREDGATRDVFCHFSAVRCDPGTSFVELAQGERVTFGMGAAPDGRACAVDVAHVSGGGDE